MTLETFDQFCEKVKWCLSGKGYGQLPDEESLLDHFNEGYTYQLSAGIFIDTWEEEAISKGKYSIDF